MMIRRTIGMLAVAVVAAVAMPSAAPAQGPPLTTDSIEVLKQQVERGARVKILQALTYTALNVNFDQMPARDAFEYFGTALGINLIGRYSDDAMGFGIDPESPITLHVRAMPAADVLQLMLEQCSTRDDACTWQLRNSYMEVGTKARLGVPEAQVLRVYSISDLVRTAPNFDDAPPLRLDEVYGEYWVDPYRYGGRGGGTIRATTSGYATGGGTEYEANSDQQRDDRGYQLLELIRKMIEPDAWAANGGTWATIEYNEEALIVTAPDFVHRQLAGYPDVPPPMSKEDDADE